MSQMPAGWYPDPMSAGPSRVVRYWDGTRWTQHVQAAPEVAPDPGGEPTAPYASAGPAQPGQQPPPHPTPYGAPPASPYGSSPYGQSPYGQSPYGQSPYGQSPSGASPYGAAPMAPWADPRATTPDGEPLSGWWRRVGASVIDGIILSLIISVVGFPWLSDVMSAYVDFFNEALDAAEAGLPAPDANEFVLDLMPTLLVLAVIALVVNLVYTVAFLKWRAATPGKMAVGIKIRLRDTPGPLSWGTIGMRWLGQNLASFLGLIPVIGVVASFYPWIDCLWPLWDGKRQALHDKIAKTNVVRTR